MPDGATARRGEGEAERWGEGRNRGNGDGAMARRGEGEKGRLGEAATARRGDRVSFESQEPAIIAPSPFPPFSPSHRLRVSPSALRPTLAYSSKIFRDISAASDPCALLRKTSIPSLALTD